jgi:hypothetical protein
MPFTYVYILQSQKSPNHFYTGFTDNLKKLRALKEILWPFEARIFEFWRGFGDGACPQRPATEPERSQNSKRPLSLNGFQTATEFL